MDTDYFRKRLNIGRSSPKLPDLWTNVRHSRKMLGGSIEWNDSIRQSGLSKTFFYQTGYESRESIVSGYPTEKIWWTRNPIYMLKRWVFPNPSPKKCRRGKLIEVSRTLLIELNRLCELNTLDKELFSFSYRKNLWRFDEWNGWWKWNNWIYQKSLNVFIFLQYLVLNILIIKKIKGPKILLWVTPYVFTSHSEESLVFQKKVIFWVLIPSRVRPQFFFRIFW